MDRAAVLGRLDEWRDGLTDAGVEVVAAGAPDADLTVAPASLAPEAIASRTPMLILDGYSRDVRRTDLNVTRLIARPSTADPALLLPLEQPQPTAYAIRHWSIVDRRWKVVRREAARALAGRGIWPFAGSVVTVAQRGPSPPAIVAAAGAVGLPPDTGWALTLGKGDVLSRNVFHLFPRGGDRPLWVLKFARVPDYSAPFDRDERGLRLAAEAGGTAAAHAPRFLGRFTWDGLHASLETAASGYRLRELLTGTTRHAEKLRLIDNVSSWLIELAIATAAPPEALGPERRRLRDEIAPQWAELGVTQSLVDDLPTLPAVLQHNDVGSWNIVVDDGDFELVDWESARENGLPLWDLLYFLADALALLEGEVSGETRDRHTVALFRGEKPSSHILFRWVRKAVTDLNLPPESVGPIATLCWLHHSLSHVSRGTALDRHGSPGDRHIHGTERVGRAWLADGALGASWDLWQ